MPARPMWHTSSDSCSTPSCDVVVMKPLIVWLLLVLLVFGIAVGVTKVLQSDDGEKVFVVLDSSFPMKADWEEALGELDDLDDARASEFALATEKGFIHSWADDLDPAGASPYAPRDLSGLLKPDLYGEMADAERLVLVTNAPATETDALTGWEVIRVGD